MKKDKFAIELKLKYGKLNKTAETYNEALDIYREMKNEYANVTCEISVINLETNNVLFTKFNNRENSFESNYEKLMESLINIARLEIELKDKEKEYNDYKRDFYHKIEQTNLEDIDLEMLEDFKTDLTKRRIVKQESRRCYAFHQTLLGMIDLLSDYKKNQYQMENAGSTVIYRKSYYTESPKLKVQRYEQLKELSVIKDN